MADPLNPTSLPAVLGRRRRTELVQATREGTHTVQRIIRRDSVYLAPLDPGNPSKGA